MCEYVMFHYTSFQANEPIAWCINIQCLLPFVFKLQFITSIYHAFLFQIIDIYHSSTKKKNDIVQLYFIISLPYPFRKRRKKKYYSQVCALQPSWYLYSTSYFPIVQLQKHIRRIQCMALFQMWHFSLYAQYSLIKIYPSLVQPHDVRKEAYIKQFAIYFQQIHNNSLWVPEKRGEIHQHLWEMEETI